MNREKIIQTLIRLGFKQDVKGIDHIVDAVILLDSGWTDVPLTKAYWKIAKDNRISVACVERRIRTALSSARANGSYAAMKYPQNKMFINWFYKFLKEREDGGEL